MSRVLCVVASSFTHIEKRETNKQQKREEEEEKDDDDDDDDEHRRGRGGRSSLYFSLSLSPPLSRSTKRRRR